MQEIGIAHHLRHLANSTSSRNPLKAGFVVRKYHFFVFFQMQCTFQFDEDPSAQVASVKQYLFVPVVVPIPFIVTFCVLCAVSYAVQVTGSVLHSFSDHFVGYTNKCFLAEFKNEDSKYTSER